MAEENPIKELKELLPSLQGKLLDADIYNITKTLEIAEKGKRNGDLYGNLLYMERILDSENYYQDHLEAADLYRKSIGLLRKLESEDVFHA